jgi:amidase
MSLDIQTFNDLYGVTNNPYDLNLTSGGSSGGSSAAVSLGIVPLALCTDLSGSARIPASFCGVYSIRPTTYRISTIGCVI